MKKTLSVVLAIVMVLVMSLSVFAAEKPADSADVAAWTEYYTEVLANEETDPIDVAAAIFADVTAGDVDVNVALDAVEAASLALGTDYAESVLNAVFDFAGITEAPELPDFLPVDDSIANSPIFATIADILDTIFGAISNIAGSFFKDNNADDYCLFPTEPPVPEDTTIEEIAPPLGDNSLIAIGAVALVAGAALVLTRKKDKDAE